MKKLFAILLIFSSLIILCSCTPLEEMKEQHVRYSKDSEDVLEYLGNRYYHIGFDENTTWGDSANDINGYVTQNDVPVLLSQMFNHSWARINEAKTAIRIYREKELYFFREDVYNRYKEMSFDEIFCTYSFDSYLHYEETKNRSVPAECVVAIRQIAAGTPMKSIELANYACVGALNRCDIDEEILLFEYSVYRSDEGKYYLESVKGDQYEVPEKYLPAFDKLCA